jgi:DNA-binding CsgD family transcriptional regulator/tetratricopeptide (TPR) repeat protein
MDRDPVLEPGDLHGRAPERAALDDVISAVRAGESRTLVIHGEAGIGKTALLGYAAEAARELQVVRAAGVESEMELAFASLHQLCVPLLGAMDRLPPPQRNALRVAFGLTAGPAPDRFLVGLAVLTLFSEASEQRPLLCLVDDAQWLDDVSASTLLFVARRLLAEPVGLVFAAREPFGGLDVLPSLEVAGLALADARALLQRVAHVPLDERIRDRIVAETGGNPLALMELSGTRLAGGLGLLDVPMRPVEERYQRRIQALPADARLLLLVAAAEPVGDPFLVWSAAHRLGVEASAAAATDGLLTISATVQFRHPLVRSAVYRLAPAEERRTVHLALAEVTDRDADPDRRAWHLAAAALEPDEGVAAELDRSAGRAMARGGIAAATAFLQRAHALTAEPARRAARALAAAEASFQAGAFDAAQGLLAMAESDPLDGFQRARVQLIRGHIALVLGYGGDAAPLLLEAARQLEPFDVELSREAYLAAYGSAMSAGHLGQDGVFLDVCRAIEALPRTSDAADLLLEGLARMHTRGRAAAMPTLERAAAAVADLPARDVLRWGWLAPMAAHVLWDPERSRAIYARQVKIVREAGALAELPVHLSALALDLAWNGDLGGARLLIAESETVAAVTGSQLPPFAALRLHALKGDEAAAAALIDGTIEAGAARGQGLAVRVAQWAAAVLYNGLGRYEQALSAARVVTAEDADPYPNMWALPELIEAASRVGELAQARAASDRLVEMTQPAGTDWALGTQARSRALLCDGEAAERLYQEGVRRFATTGLRPELARAQLLYGEWLRREGRRTDARAQLRAAHGLFTATGMEAFAERTRRELVATGETVRKRSAETRDELTPQEAQIAGLARDGLTNPEIGAQLFLSTRTVEWHLRKVYAKLGIGSRHQLRDAVSDR